MTGKFITFEGSEGSGKSTQAKLLCAYLRRKKIPVMALREPGNTKIGEKIRRILLDPVNKKMLVTCEMLLYMAARAQLVEEIIKPALKKGKFVVCDRFLDSTLSYQGFGGKLDVKIIKQVGKIATCGIKPDLTFLLDLDPKEGLRRAGRVKDRIELRKLSYHQKVRRGYFKLAKQEPGRIKIVKVQNLKGKTQELIQRYIDKII
ncbi:MAG: dTMP kinase [Candidatus Omnitrophota bacterium]|nr:dTMP kinase [Candidatus Omnitrophota bacterium]